MKPVMLLALLLWQALSGSAPVDANPQYLRYQRAVNAAAESDKAVPSSTHWSSRMRRRR